MESIIFLAPDPQLFRQVRGLTVLVRHRRRGAHASNPSGIPGAVDVLHWTLTNVIVASCRRGTAALPLVAAGW
jgi:hypothetical protein